MKIVMQFWKIMVGFYILLSCVPFHNVVRNFTSSAEESGFIYARADIRLATGASVCGLFSS